MSCVKCSSEILCENVSYSCGHRYHIECILKSKLSLRKPTCPACDKGSLIYVSDDKTNVINERGPQLIHYLIAFILIVVSVYLLFVSD